MAYKSRLRVFEARVHTNVHTHRQSVAIGPHIAPFGAIAEAEVAGMGFSNSYHLIDLLIEWHGGFKQTKTNRTTCGRASSHFVPHFPSHPLSLSAKGRPKQPPVATQAAGEMFYKPLLGLPVPPWQSSSRLAAPTTAPADQRESHLE